MIEKDTTAKVIDACRVEEAGELLVKPRVQLNRAHLSEGAARLVFTESAAEETLLSKLTNLTILGSAFDVRTGLQAYEKGKGDPPQTARDVAEHVFDRVSKVDSTCHRYLEGRDVSRYSTNWSGMWMSWGPWLSQPRELSIFQRPRILIREITAKPPHRIHANLTLHEYLSNKSVITVLHTRDDEDALKSLLGIINSRLISFFYGGRAVKSARKLFPKIVVKNLREFPIPVEIQSKQLVTLVERMLKLHEELPLAKSPDTQTRLRREIAATDRAIDQLVYQLYELTPEEIALIEAVTAPAAKSDGASVED